MVIASISMFTTEICPVRAPGGYFPLILLLISALYKLFVCLLDLHPYLLIPYFSLSLFFLRSFFL